MKTRIFLLNSILLLAGFLLGCSSPPVASPTPTAVPAAEPTAEPAAAPTAGPTAAASLSPEQQAAHLETFETVWQTVNQTYFDRDFGGVDWQAVHDEYEIKIRSLGDETEFFIVLNEMCFELGVSHLLVLPAELSEALEPVLSSPGELGLDVRQVGGKPVITAVKAGSAAEAAGLRPGFVLLSIDGESVENAADLLLLRVPPFNERQLRSQAAGAFLERLYGQPGQEVAITYLDERDRQRQVSMQMQARQTEPFFSEDLPVMYVDFEAVRLRGGIGYIRLSGFLPPILDGVLEAIDEMQTAPGLIIDVRGNPGGFFPVRKAIASRFFAEPALLWQYFTRPGLDLPGFESQVYTDPPAQAYMRPLVVLVDELSTSSSEEFAGALSANGRAVIVGARTPGSVLVADVRTLDDGSLFMYPLAQTRTSDGAVLEGRGVIPDLEVELDRESLLQGIDPQLEAAIRYLENELED